MRLFVAVNLPPELRSAIYAATAPLRAAAGAAWVRDENLHLTMKFLGDVDEARVPALVEAIGGAAMRARSFDAIVAGAGAFPNLRRPRVVWLGVRDEGRLALVAGAVDHACEAIGFAREERAYRAHLTLGRVRRPLRDTEAAALEREARGMRHSWTTTVREIDVMQSELARGGSRYRVIASAPLGGD